MRQKIIEVIYEITEEENPFEKLESIVTKFDDIELKEAILTCSAIPEIFTHDSSEEKLWAKYCDILLAVAWNRLGINAEVLRVRGDSADVLGKSDNYSIVGDAKAFRLSRTAKNQKDFKITALDDWRRSNTFACLVAPLYQYPSTRSQIYEQSCRRNVTLISYTHLIFLIDYLPPNTDLTPLWSLGKSLTPSKDARSYWQQIDDTIIVLTNQTYKTLQENKISAKDKIHQIAQEGISYWQSIIDDYQKLSKEQAIKRLIVAEKIDGKITQIENTMKSAEKIHG